MYAASAGVSGIGVHCASASASDDGRAGMETSRTGDGVSLACVVAQTRACMGAENAGGEHEWHG